MLLNDKLKSLSVATRNRIAGSISMLGYNPDDKRLDVKKLSGREGYRLRVGQWRVIYDRDDHIKVIAIEKIAARGDVYK